MNDLPEALRSKVAAMFEPRCGNCKWHRTAMEGVVVCVFEPPTVLGVSAPQKLADGRLNPDRHLILPVTSYPQVNGDAICSHHTSTMAQINKDRSDIPTADTAMVGAEE